MSGIINYFHGESGTVSDCWWELADKTPAFAMAIEGDPHRTIARDYGSDIGIDPQITLGDRVIYLRLEDTTGIWVQSAGQSAADLKDAVARVLENRRWIERWQGAESDSIYIDIAREIYKSRGDPCASPALGRVMLRRRYWPRGGRPLRWRLKILGMTGPGQSPASFSAMQPKTPYSRGGSSRI